MKLISKTYFSFENNNNDIDSALRIYRKANSKESNYKLVGSNEEINKVLKDFTKQSEVIFKSKIEIYNFIENFNHHYSYSFNPKIVLALSSYDCGDIIISKMFYTNHYKKYSGNKNNIWSAYIKDDFINDYFDIKVGKYSLAFQNNNSLANTRQKAIDNLLNNIENILKKLNIKLSDKELKDFINSLNIS